MLKIEINGKLYKFHEFGYKDAVYQYERVMYDRGFVLLQNDFEDTSLHKCDACIIKKIKDEKNKNIPFPYTCRDIMKQIINITFISIEDCDEDAFWILKNIYMED